VTVNQEGDLDRLEIRIVNRLITRDTPLLQYIYIIAVI